MIIPLAALLAMPVFAAESVHVSSRAVSHAEQALFDRCADPKVPVDVDALLADPTARQNFSALTFEEAGDLTYYKACRALAGSPGGCSTLDGIDGALKGADARCSKFESKARIAQVALRGGDAAAVCREQMGGGETKKIEGAERACGLIVSAVRAGDVDGACPELKKQGFIPRGETCRDNLIFWAWEGKPQSCSAIKEIYARAECKESTALIAGLRSPASCAAAPACLALQGRSPGACDTLRRAFSKELCARAVKAGADPMKAQALKDRMVKEAAAKAKAEDEVRRKAAEKKAQQSQKNKPQFKNGQAMSDTTPANIETMKRLEKGLPPKPSTGDKDADAQ